MQYKLKSSIQLVILFYIVDIWCLLIFYLSSAFIT